MRKLAVFVSTVVAVGTITSIVWAATSSVKVTSPVTIKVIEHATTDVVTDTGKAGDTAGDLLTWHNRIFDATNKHQVGRDQGDCIRISPALGTWECRWITSVGDGAITVEGVFSDTKNNTLVITGGRGKYQNARGTMDLVARKGGAEYAFIFHVIP